MSIAIDQDINIQIQTIPYKVIQLSQITQIEVEGGILLELTKKISPVYFCMICMESKNNGSHEIALGNYSTECTTDLFNPKAE